MNADENPEYVFLREEPVPADLVMVFAAANEVDMLRRTRRGVELHKAGLAPRILVTGGGVLARARPEAKRMAELARELGVNAADLLVEDRSANTFDNVQFSLTLLRSAGLLDTLSTVLLVSSEWHMRRVRCTVRKFFPSGIRLVCCPTCQGCHRDNWTATTACQREVTSEALLLETLLATGALTDE